MIEVLKWPSESLRVPELGSPLVVALDLAAVAVCAVTGVLAARGKRLDLFGTTVIAVVSALGGGTLRDMLLGNDPVFWVRNPLVLVAAVSAGLLTFLLARAREFRPGVFQIPDAVGLSLFTVAGAEKALLAQHGWLVAVIMGVVTAVFGGILRDVICREVPGVLMRTELYATASMAGAAVFVVLSGLHVNTLLGAVIAMSLIFLIRLAAIRCRVTLPTFG